MYQTYTNYRFLFHAHCNNDIDHKEISMQMSGTDFLYDYIYRHFP